MVGRPRAAFALILLFAISLGLRTYPVLALHFDGLYGQDPYAYYDYGQQVREAIGQLQLPGKFFWPLGYPALVALGFALAGKQPLGPQLITLVAGALVSILVFLIAAEVARQIGRSERFARIAGLMAWAVTAVCGQLIQSSMVIMADAPGLMWASLSAWAVLVYGRTRRPGWIALSAFALGWATMTRWQYASLALPWALYVIFNRPFVVRHAALAVAVGFVTLSPQIASTLQNPDGLIGHEWVQGWSISNALLRDFVTVDGTFHYDQSPAQYYVQPLYFAYFMSPLLLPLLLIGLALLARHIGLVIILGWGLIVYGFLAGIPYENIRFALALFPPLAVLVGLGAAWLLTDLRGYARLRWVIAPLVCLLIIYGLMTTLRTTGPILTGFVANKDNDLAAAHWIAQNVPEPDATVYCLDLLLTMQHYTVLHPVQIYQMTTDTLSAQLQGKQPHYAVFNVWTTEHQWRGESPWLIYHWLLDHPGLTQIGTFGNYTLYRIKS